MLTNQHDPQDTLETFQPVTVGIHVQEMKGFRKELILSLLAPNAFQEVDGVKGEGGKESDGKDNGKKKNGKESDSKNGKESDTKNGKDTNKKTTTHKRHSPTLDAKTKKPKLFPVS